MDSSDQSPAVWTTCHTPVMAPPAPISPMMIGAALVVIGRMIRSGMSCIKLVGYPGSSIASCVLQEDLASSDLPISPGRDPLC